MINYTLSWNTIVTVKWIKLHTHAGNLLNNHRSCKLMYFLIKFVDLCIYIQSLQSPISSSTKWRSSHYCEISWFYCGSCRFFFFIVCVLIEASCLRVGLFVVFAVVSYDFSKFRFRRILVKRIYWSRAKCMNGGYGHADVKEWSYKGLLFRNWRSYLWFCYRSPWLYLPPPILSGLQVLLVSVTATVDIVVCFLDFIAAWQCKDHQ